MKKILFSIMLLALTIVPVMSASAAVTDSKAEVCKGIDLTAATTGSCDGATAGTAVQTIVSNVINVLSFVVGIVAVIMIIIGGFKYVMSGGDSNSISGAKNTILYALIGLAVALLAQVIVRFVITRV